MTEKDANELSGKMSSEIRDLANKFEDILILTKIIGLWARQKYQSNHEGRKD